MTKPTFGKFKVLVGIHNEGGNTYNESSPAFESVSDLCKHNSPGCVKFARAEDVTSVRPASESQENEDGFDEMTMEELHQWASEGDISLEGCGRSKAKIIAKLRAAAE